MPNYSIFFQQFWFRQKINLKILLLYTPSISFFMHFTENPCNFDLKIKDFGK